MAPRKGSKMNVDRSVDITGERFGMLVAVRKISQTSNGTWKWLCNCDCGGSSTPTIAALRVGTRSCGCIRGKNGTHRMTLSPTYLTWKSMKARCSNPNSPDFKHYGARGITFDPTWASFENFLADMGERPDGLTLDRKNNDGPYCKDNCKWSTAVEQANNKRNNRFKKEAA